MTLVWVMKLASVLLRTTVWGASYLAFQSIICLCKASDDIRGYNKLCSLQ